MNLTCSNKVIKYLMFIVNFIFVITGIIILAVGVSVKTFYYDYDIFLDGKYFSLPNMLIATGSLIFFISFLGCFGAMRENWMLLMAFSVCMVIIFIFELSVGIAGYVLRDKTANYLETKLTESMGKYNSNSAIGDIWDSMQSEFKCCGAVNMTDWYSIFNSYDLPVSCCPEASGIVGVFYCNAFPEVTTPTTPTTVSTSSTTTTVTTPIPNGLAADPSTTTIEPTTTTPAPNSTTATTPAPDPTTATTPEPTTAIVYPPSSSQPYSTGCRAAFGSYVEAHAVDIGAVGIALAVIQLFGIAFSFHMALQLKNGYQST